MSQISSPTINTKGIYNIIRLLLEQQSTIKGLGQQLTICLKYLGYEITNRIISTKEELKLIYQVYFSISFENDQKLIPMNPSEWIHFLSSVTKLMTKCTFVSTKQVSQEEVYKQIFLFSASKQINYDIIAQLNESQEIPTYSEESQEDNNDWKDTQTDTNNESPNDMCEPSISSLPSTSESINFTTNQLKNEVNYFEHENNNQQENDQNHKSLNQLTQINPIHINEKDLTKDTCQQHQNTISEENQVQNQQQTYIKDLFQLEEKQFQNQINENKQYHYQRQKLIKYLTTQYQLTSNYDQLIQRYILIIIRQLIQMTLIILITRNTINL